MKWCKFTRIEISLHFKSQYYVDRCNNIYEWLLNWTCRQKIYDSACPIKAHAFSNRSQRRKEQQDDNADKTWIMFCYTSYHVLCVNTSCRTVTYQSKQQQHNGYFKMQNELINKMQISMLIKHPIIYYTYTIYKCKDILF